MELLNNPWVVGVAGGVLSGFIVAWISRFLFSKKDNREYIQRVSAANREVIYSIRPGISEGITPEKEVVDVLISATARKYGVDKKDVFGPKEIGQELLKEVMDSSFISAKTKEQYCERLTVLQRGGATNEDDSVHSSQAVLSGSIEKFRARSITVTSLMMGILASTMTLVTTFVKKGRDNNPLFGSNVFLISPDAQPPVA